MTGQFFVGSTAVRPVRSIRCRLWPSSTVPVGPFTSCIFSSWQPRLTST